MLWEIQRKVVAESLMKFLLKKAILVPFLNFGRNCLEYPLIFTPGTCAFRKLTMSFLGAGVTEAPRPLSVKVSLLRYNQLPYPILLNQNGVPTQI